MKKRDEKPPVLTVSAQVAAKIGVEAAPEPPRIPLPPGFTRADRRRIDILAGRVLLRESR